jgi:transcriptional regulator with XRE-family HTH domain
LRAVKRLRLEKGWSQKDLADKSGVGQDTISGVESGKHEPRPSTLRKLAEALDAEVVDFFSESEEVSTRPKGSGRASFEPAPSIAEMFARAGITVRFAAMGDDQWGALLDGSDAEGALNLCRAVGAERLATQELRWQLGKEARSIEARQAAGQMLGIYMAREFEAAAQAQSREAVSEVRTALQRELALAGR